MTAEVDIGFAAILYYQQTFFLVDRNKGSSAGIKVEVIGLDSVAKYNTILRRL